MKKARILFYKTPKFKFKYLVNWLITIWTWCWYSHCEAWTVDKKGRFYMGQGATNGISVGYTEWVGDEQITIPLWTGTCWTSTLRDKANGTVKRDASKVLTHPKNWVYFELELTDLQYTLLEFIMNKAVENNKGYALWDLLKFLSPIHFEDSNRNICSEAVNNWLVAIGVLLGGGIISPKALFKKLIKLGLKPKELI